MQPVIKNQIWMKQLVNNKTEVLAQHVME